MPFILYHYTILIPIPLGNRFSYFKFMVRKIELYDFQKLQIGLKLFDSESHAHFLPWKKCASVWICVCALIGKHPCDGGGLLHPRGRPRLRPTPHWSTGIDWCFGVCTPLSAGPRELPLDTAPCRRCAFTGCGTHGVTGRPRNALSLQWLISFKINPNSLAGELSRDDRTVAKLSLTGALEGSC